MGAWVPNGNMMRRTASEGGLGGLASPAPGSIGRQPLRMPNDGSSDASRMYFHPADDTSREIGTVPRTQAVGGATQLRSEAIETATPLRVEDFDAFDASSGGAQTVQLVHHHRTITGHIGGNGVVNGSGLGMGPSYDMGAEPYLVDVWEHCPHGHASPPQPTLVELGAVRPAGMVPEMLFTATSAKLELEASVGSTEPSTTLQPPGV